MTGYSPPGPLGAGTAPLGNLGAVVLEEDAIACLAAAWDVGIRHYDTAPHYGAGLARDTGWAMRCAAARATPIRSPPRSADCSTPAPDTRGIEPRLCARIAVPPDLRLHRRRHDPLPGGQPPAPGLNRFDIVYIHDCAEDWHGAAFKDRFAEAMAGAAKVLTAMRDRGEIRGWGMG